MDVRQLRYLIALVQERHFSRAAAKCHVSQPALSTQIRKLEEELGVPIVKRGNTYGGLTPEGERVMAWARRVVENADSLMDEAALLRGELVGALNIGVIPSALPMLPLLTGALLATHPELRFNIRSISSKEIQRGLDDLSLDAGITYLDNEPLNAVDTLDLYHEEFSLLIPEALLKVLPDPLEWLALKDVPLCLLAPEMQNRRIIDRVFEQIGLQPEPVIQSNSVVTLYGHVREAGLCTIIPRNHFHLLGLSDGMALVRLAAPVVQHKIGLVRHVTQVQAPRVAALWDVAQGADITTQINRVTAGL